MRKVFKNLVVGSLAFMTGAALFTLSRKRIQKENVVIEKEEELERKYIDLSDQLKKIKEEKEEVKVKEYTA